MEERKPRTMDAERLWNYALRALGGRAHSTGELREKLRRRAEKVEDVDATIVRLIWVALSVVPGGLIGGAIAYFLAWIIIPKPQALVSSSVSVTANPSPKAG